MKLLYLSILLCFTYASIAQDNLDWLRENKTDSLYREDQFYAGFGFNFLTELPTEVEQSGFSGGLIFGFIRDMPINKRRNLSLGLGLGFNLNTYGQTLQIKREGEEDVFQPIEGDVNYDSNRFSANLIEIPFQLRWRSSDVDKLSFWRIYLGFKFGYVFTSRSVFKSPEESFNFRNLEDINDFWTFATFTFGYGAVNFTVETSLNPIFDSVEDSRGEEVSLKPIKVGLIFFFL